MISTFFLCFPFEHTRKKKKNTKVKWRTRKKETHKRNLKDNKKVQKGGETKKIKKDLVFFMK